MNTNPDFNLNVHRGIAERAISGRATVDELQESQAALLSEVARLAPPAVDLDDLDDVMDNMIEAISMAPEIPTGSPAS